MNKRYFSRLSFSFKFPEEARGSTVAFAYGVPYGYSELQGDLMSIRKILLRDEQATFKKEEVTTQLANYSDGDEVEGAPG